VAISLHDGLPRPPDNRSATSWLFYDTTGQVRALPTLSGKRPQTADSASGGFLRQVPRLPVPRKERAGRATCHWAAPPELMMIIEVEMWL
jgi:hypothetical protein